MFFLRRFLKRENQKLKIIDENKITVTYTNNNYTNVI